jgi:hypothetical protein
MEVATAAVKVALTALDALKVALRASTHQPRRVAARLKTVGGSSHDGRYGHG